MRFGVTTPGRRTSRPLDQPVVPVTRRLLADSETAVGIYRKLAGNRPGTVLLESAEQGKRWSRYSFVGVRSAGVLTERGRRHPVARRRRARAHRRPAGRPAGRRPHARPADAHAPRARSAAADRRPGRLPRLRRRPAAGAAARHQPDDLGMPELAMMLVHRPGGARPHRRHGAADRERVPGGAAAGGYDDAVARLDAMAADRPRPCRRASPSSSRPSRRRCRATCTPGAYADGVERIREHIRAGDAFQVVLAQRFRLPPTSMRSTSTGCCARPTPRRTCTCSASPAGRARSTSSAPRPRRW